MIFIKNKKLSEYRKGKTLEQLGHKLNCQCGVCKQKRGEYVGKNHPNYGRTVSDEQKTKNRKTWKQKYENGYINPTLGRKHTKEEKELLSKKSIEYFKEHGWNCICLVTDSLTEDSILQELQ